MKPKVILLVALMAVFFISTTASAQQEEITLSTYYPAPFGEYDELCAEKLLVDLPSAAELFDMREGDCHITRSLIVGTTGGGFSYDALNAAGLPLYDGDVIIEGSVGIGTTVPGNKLTVEGSGAGGVALLNLSSTSSEATMRYTLGSEFFAVGKDSTGLFFYDSTGTPGTRLFIQDGGLVGIGTAGPSDKLSIVGTSGNTNILVDSTEGATVILDRGAVSGYGAGYNIRTAGADKWSIGLQPGDEILSISDWSGSAWDKNLVINATTGNVGIGTTQPRTILHIKDPATSQPNGLLIENNSGGPVGGKSPRVELVDTFMGDVTTAPLWAIHNWQDTFGIFRQPNIYTAGVEYFHIANNGNVGINVWNPGVGWDTPSGPVILEVNGPVIQRLRTGNRLAFSGFFNSGGPSQPYLEFNIDDVMLFGISVWPSSITQKTDIADIEIDTSQIYKLKPVSFYYKDQIEKTIKQFGLIAEEVEKYFPQLIMRSSKEDKIIGLDYGRFSVLLLNELQKMKKENDVLKSQLEEINKRLDKLEQNQKIVL